MARRAGGTGGGGAAADRDPLPVTASVFVLVGVYLVAVYGVVASIGGGAGDGSSARSIVATAIVAVTFERARSAARYLANRMFFGTRVTPLEAVTLLSEHLVTAPDQELMEKLAEVVVKATGAVGARVCVLEDGGLREVAVRNEREACPSDAAPAGAVVRVPVRDGGEVLGEITVVHRADAKRLPGDGVVHDLAALATSSFRNLRLRSELRAQVDELVERSRALRLSRRQVLEAQFDERRRLERDIHDGGQQYLTALGIKLTYAKLLAKKRPEQFESLVGELQALADETVEAMRDLAERLHPATLAELGVVAALREAAPRFPFDVAISGPGTRYPQSLEAALYLTCIEALQNVTKHAMASRVEVVIRRVGCSVSLTVADDGRGFEVRDEDRHPPLRAMGERVSALGGRLEVSSSPGRGTRVAVSLPLRQDEEEVVST